MAAMSSEGDGVIYAIAVVGSCAGEAKMSVILNVLFFYDPLAKKRALQKMERPHVLHIFLQSWYQIKAPPFFNSVL